MIVHLVEPRTLPLASFAGTTTVQHKEMQTFNLGGGGKKATQVSLLQNIQVHHASTGYVRHRPQSEQEWGPEVDIIRLTDVSVRAATLNFEFNMRETGTNI